jgi:hypothetical protein
LLGVSRQRCVARCSRATVAGTQERGLLCRRVLTARLNGMYKVNNKFVNR